jgi:hypothetical protein
VEHLVTRSEIEAAAQYVREHTRHRPEFGIVLGSGLAALAEAVEAAQEMAAYEPEEDEKPKELIRTPIEGLFMAGYQAFSALFVGGIPTAMESGERAAHAVLEGADPIEEILIPGMKQWIDERTIQT